MSKLSEEAYMLEAKEFLSKSYHDEIIFPYHLEKIFREAIIASGRVDRVKKSLYYGREFKGKSYPYLKTTIKHQDKYKDLLHAVLGVFSEAGELMEHLYLVLSGRCTVDFVNFNEELGDLYWYLMLLHSAIGTKPSESWLKNIEKLRTRYGVRFSEGKANNRDLEKERRTLER